MFDLMSKIFGAPTGEQVLFLVFCGLGVLAYFGWKGILARPTVPGMMTSLGIFGTFWGVYIALIPLEFAADSMNDDIQALLEGMTTAFLTSLLGLGSAIVAKACWSNTATQEKSRSPEHEDIAERLEAIKKAIAGDDDSSMVTQMQKLRDENRDGFKKLDGLAETIQDALGDNLKNLIEEIRDVVGKQLGDSLKELIASIEKALIEQFGTTFVQFNEAVQALKQWQEDHRKQVKELTIAFNVAAKGIEKIKDDCATIPEAMNALAPIIQDVNQQVNELNAQLEAFAEMKQHAREAFPEIKKNLDKIGEDLRLSAESFTGLHRSIHGVFDATATVVQESTATMRQTVEQAHKETIDKVNSVLVDTGAAFADRMDKEINRVSSKWGDNMIAIAKKCDDAIRTINEINQNQ